MAATTLTYGTATFVNFTTLTSLTNGSSATGPTVDNTTNQYVEVLVNVATASTSPSTTGTLEIYAQASYDGSTWEDDTNDHLVAVLNVTATGTFDTLITLSPAFGGIIPPYWRLRAKNATGVTTGGGTVYYRGIILTTA